LNEETHWRLLQAEFSDQTSVCKLLRTNRISWFRWKDFALFRDGINQILVGISNSPIIVLVQFNGRPLISVVGSKIENRFLIIFNLFY
jgi:hypothetical protein